MHVGFSNDGDTRTALEELLAELEAHEAELTLVFFSPSYDETVVSRVLDDRLGSRALAGTTAGEVSSEGITHDSMVGISFSGPDVRAAIDVVPNLDDLSLVPLVHLPDELARRIGRSSDELDDHRHIWLLFSDGLSGTEDLFTPFFMQASPDANLVGGSLGDGDRFESVQLAYHGRLYDNAAAVVLLEYDRPFELIHENHMQFTDRWLEVTGVSRAGRLLEELDDRPAIEAYADVLGLAPEDVSRDVTALHPLGFRFRGRPFVCSILQRGPNGSFFMANSIHPGEQLNVLKPGDLVAQTRSALTDAVGRLETRPETALQAMLLFNCKGRYEEAKKLDKIDALSAVFRQYPVAGFNSLGEQFGSMHTNHSLTGIAFG